MNETEKTEIPVATVILQMALPYGYWHITDAEGRVYVGKDYLTQSAAEQDLLQALNKIYEAATTGR